METDLREEGRAARESAVVVAHPPRGHLIARGADRQAFLHNMLSNAVKELAAGKGCRAELLDDRGHVVADFRVLVREDEVRLDCETPRIAATARAALEKFVIMDDVTFTDASATTALLTVSGPRAAGVLGSLGVASLPGDPWGSVRASIGGSEVLVVASRWTGRSDHDLVVPEPARETVLASLVGAGALRIRPETFEALRVEAGVATQSGELDDVLALEARLAPEAVSFTKGCYLGQEVMARIDARGHVNRTLVGLTFDGGGAAPRGSAVRAAEKEVGRVTSSVVSPTLGKPIALAYVRREQSAPGTAVTVATEAGERAAVVAALPFV